jgi:peptidoglycan/LPS O-acetylase OafA/YrhL
MDTSARPVTRAPFAKVQSIAAPVVGRRISALDGVRGAAILLVVVYHLAVSVRDEFGYTNRLLRIGEFGWTGVGLFFVLSGFLITGILYDSKDNSRPSGRYFRNFYMRRVLRILPLYYGVLLFVLLLRAVWPEAGFYGRANPAWMWVYLTNIVIAWKGSGAFGFMFHFWSLAIEQHFYLAWPLAMFLLNRRRLMQLAAALSFLSLGLRIALVLGGINPVAIYVLTSSYLDALCLGAVLALLVRRPEGVRNLARPAWMAGSVSGILILAIIVVRHTLDPLDPVMQTLGYSLLAVFFGALLILSLTSPLQRVLNLGILRWFGKYSYGIYVWHPILFVLVFHTDPARAIRGGSGTVEMLVSLGLALMVTLAATLLSWHFWESQFLKLKRHFR